MSAAELYMEHLDRIFQQEPEFYKLDSVTDGVPGVTAIVYKDVPEPGYITGVTYGLSLVKHPDWKLGRPELCISVKSDQTAWATVAAYMANQLRGECAFSYGDYIDFQGTITADSEMGAFFIFAPAILEREDFLDIEVGTDYKINIAGLYPIYPEEIEVFDKMGVEEFWNHPNFDMYDINRNKIK